MTNEEKEKRIHTMILASRILNRKIVNLQYQMANFLDDANFLRINDVSAIIAYRDQLDGDLYAATEVIENEHKKSE